MRSSLALLFTVLAVSCTAATVPLADLVLVTGGTFRNPKSNYFGRLRPVPYLGRPVAVASFYLGRHEVTQREWTAVMGANPSHFRGDDLPVETVSWYDCIEYCNRRSLAEGLEPVYRIDRARRDPDNTNPIDDVKWTVTLDPRANGYRLPTEAEWEYAASGGALARGYTFSGDDIVDHVAWYFANSGDQPLSGAWSWAMIEQNHNRPQPVGRKPPNELGLYDLSGNVREWCWNAYAEEPSIGTEPTGGSGGRVWRGGGWLGADFCCASSFRAGFEASGKGADQGFRVCRNP